MAANQCECNVGDKFCSFEELQQLLLLYQKQQSVQLYVRDSHTTVAAVKRNTKKNFKTELKYSELTYRCIHGGKKYTSTSTGKRPHQL
jgi:zinc finger SWIM domain-containing protein 3